MSMRTSQLRDDLLDITPSICSERARIFTNAMRRSEGQPIVLRRAKAFEAVLKGMSLYVREGELIVGNQAGRPRAAPVFPEYSVHWIEKEFEGDPYHTWERPNDVYEYDEETKQEILETIAYWRGRTVYEVMRSLIPDEARIAWDLGAIDDDWVAQNGFGNVLPNYENILRTGLRGQIERAQEHLDRLDMTQPGQVQKSWFLKAVIITNQAVIDFAVRFADKLQELGEAETDAVRKSELATMARTCRSVPGNPPTTFWEAVQAVWFIHCCIQIETNGIAISFGRFDQFLWPYYQQDIDAGRLTREQALEIVENLFVKVNEMNIFRSWEGAKFFPGYHMAINLAIGGQTRNGKDASNELTQIVLDATENMRLPKPSVSFKWFERTPAELMDRALEVVQTHSGGQPAFYNDPGVMRMLKGLGVEEEDRWNWAPVGCIEASIPGKWDFACKGPRLNKAKVLEMALNNGKDPATGITVLPGRGDLSTFENIQDVMEAYEAQLHRFMELQVMIENVNDEVHKQHDLNAFRSSLIEDCIGRGKALIEGGSIYSTDGGPTVGAMSSGDALAGIEFAVFVEKWITGAQLKHALETNFSDGTTTPTGDEIHQMLLNRAPKFGNDDDRADRWTVAITDYVGSTYQTEFKNSRYGQGPKICSYSYCQSSVTANVAMGKGVGALPSGRKAGEPLNNGVSPATGAERNGATATINSVSKLPSIWFSRGAIFNARLTPETLKTREGRSRAGGLVKTLFENNQYHIQFNVVGTDTLRDAQAHPEQYRDLMVRVAGYSAFFAPLNAELQEDIIQRSAFGQESG
ncbi:formate C-acetyltransferase/glycerol dehydratase family glycyl radical enzyme [Candidatus Bipolaricaulota bacterium]|nr:formate C-acetyltransferase/glycerol dehydratase family glycyl radical enzyme [Candidatus Bipolaricaulota bacterium]